MRHFILGSRCCGGVLVFIFVCEGCAAGFGFSMKQFHEWWRVWVIKDQYLLSASPGKMNSYTLVDVVSGCRWCSVGEVDLVMKMHAQSRLISQRNCYSFWNKNPINHPETWTRKEYGFPSTETRSSEKLSWFFWQNLNIHPEIRTLKVSGSPITKNWTLEKLSWVYW